MTVTQENTKSQPTKAPGNFLLSMMIAVENDEKSLVKIQELDALATQLAAKMEASIYKWWFNNPKSPLVEALNRLNAEAHKKKPKSSEVYADQAAYNRWSSEAQSNQSQEEGLVQSTQAQTSADASNLQMKAQMIQGMNNIISTLANLLGRIVG